MDKTNILKGLFMRARRLRLMLTISLGLILVSCGPNKLVGTWAQHNLLGLCSISYDSSGKYVSNGWSNFGSGTYKFDGQRLFLTRSDRPLPISMQCAVSPEGDKMEIRGFGVYTKWDGVSDIEQAKGLYDD